MIAPTSNDVHCSVGARLEVRESTSPPTVTFSHFATVPGLSIAAAAALFDRKSGLYWLVSNVARDGLIEWDAEASPEPCAPDSP